ncbi:DNA cytosine methyltransferase [Mesorhizobium sp. BR-1-1-8]|uniref:DNA cytosine methyltransferase n=1 Tax=Mesorhizobium sp. BR-1-1-8 TaxID=2876659 RepID=UPI001CCD1236|nr:DNA cytosine methyltransferase [Mesorhizobium sp. BR-1-1-8]MBZ9984097.1 DNA cytosine methyltransferase [Mesorhizobium sp. BR-1-1-8]
MARTFGIVDLFAGPGGLGEGFASYEEAGRTPFHIGISIEKEGSAHRTLRLRAFLREFRSQHGRLPREFIDLHAGLSNEPDWEQVDPAAFKKATEEARRLELGTDHATVAIDKAIGKLRSNFDDTILIGGPPCQAYSLVGRSRSRGKANYVPEKDARHYLFREYIRVLERLRPAVFIMENVKGMLSSTVESRLVFEMLIEDLSSLGAHGTARYELRAIRVADGVARLEEASRPADFIVRAEAFGVPQNRHRVIIVGVRSDQISGTVGAAIALPRPRTVSDAIGNLPALRSGVSREDGVEAWLSTVIAAASSLSNDVGGSSDLGRLLGEVAERLPGSKAISRSAKSLPAGYGQSNDELSRWIERPELLALAQHDTRGHMRSDLGRYLFAAAYGQLHGRSPKAEGFPISLVPNHKNWHTGVFSDRFRVQIAGEPSTTVTSHISKDGHYFIHPDPLQCRSLTVREAARLQTFPDDYLFMGNRTQQYVQVGNAVPPFLARQIAKLIHSALDKSASKNQDVREEILAV